MKIKPITLVCESSGEAVALAEEYRIIGIRTRRRGRFLTVTTQEEG